MPQELLYLWEWYLQLKGREPLSYTEMKSWSDVCKIQLESWEAEVLKTLDRIYWRALDGRRVSKPTN